MLWYIDFICCFWIQHLYVSLAELQVAREEEITRNPLSKVDYFLEPTCYDMFCLAACLVQLISI